MSIQIIIYSPKSSPRLAYTLDYIFTQRLGLVWKWTSDLKEFKDSDAIKLNYSTVLLPQPIVHIVPESILLENTIYKKTMSLNRWRQSFVIFYNHPTRVIPFDLFGAIFYFLSRYEEYLHFTKDKHQRFPASESFAYQFSFLQQPVVDEWLLYFKNILLKIQPKLSFKNETPSWQLSIDIDMIWKYLHKDAKLLWAGRAKDGLKGNIKGLKERTDVLKGNKPDPFDCFDWINEQYPKEILYFLLMQSDTPFDRNQLSSLPEFQKKIQALAIENEMAVHPSYYSLDKNLYRTEINALSNIIGKPVLKSRQHYIKLSMPATYRKLIESGITDDYTMGFAAANGFRAGTSRSFLWFDLKENKATDLRIHPFCYMDATALFYQKLNTKQTLSEITNIAAAIQKTNGNFIGIWHNYLIGDTLEHPNQQTLFTESIAALDQIIGA